MIHRRRICVPARSHFIDQPVVGAVLARSVGRRHAAIVGERRLAYQQDIEPVLLLSTLQSSVAPATPGERNVSAH